MGVYATEQERDAANRKGAVVAAIGLGVVGLLVFGLIRACSPSGPGKDHVGREFQSMADCLNFIRSDTRDQLKPITDKPGFVSGFTLQKNLHFICEAKITGTRGAFVSGRWDRLKAPSKAR